MFSCDRTGSESLSFPCQHFVYLLAEGYPTSSKMTNPLKADFNVRQNIARCVLSTLKTVLSALKPSCPTH